MVLTLAGETRRLELPRSVIEGLRSESGAIEYGAGTIAFDRLNGRLKGLEWATDSASAERFWLRDKQGRFEVQIAGIELPHGVRLTRSAGGGVGLGGVGHRSVDAAGVHGVAAVVTAATSDEDKRGRRGGQERSDASAHGAGLYTSEPASQARTVKRDCHVVT